MSYLPEGVSPLPWLQAFDAVVDANDTVQARTYLVANAAYIAHAANLYPELVDLVDQAANKDAAMIEEDWVDWLEAARALLARCKQT